MGGLARLEEGAVREGLEQEVLVLLVFLEERAEPVGLGNSPVGVLTTL